MLIGGKDGWQKEILIVEDNEDCRELLAILVKRLGYAVVEAAMGLAAIDQGCATHPDLILMDLGLPGITGDEATARLKAHPSTSNIPVVINTAFNVGAYTNRALDAGAVEILHKPLELSTLQDVMQIRTDRTWDNGSCRGAKNSATTSVADLTRSLTTPYRGSAQ